MIQQEIKKSYIFLFIFLALLLAHSSVLWGDFLRQDDWNAAFWNYHHVTGHPEYHNSAVELGRPLSTIFILVGDFIAHNLENAAFVRCFNIILLSVAAYLTYLWQIKFNPQKKILALSFAIAAFTLPASQLHSSTVSYGNMVFSIITGQLAAFYAARIFLEENSAKDRCRFYRLASLFIFLSCINYILSSMFYFVFLLIAYLSCINSDKAKKDENLKFIIKSGILMFGVVLIYFILMKLVFLIFHVTPRNLDRSVHVDLDIMEKFRHIMVMMENSFDIFAIAGVSGFKLCYMFYLIAALFLGAIVRNYPHPKNLSAFAKDYYNPLYILAIALILLVFSYSPALAPRPIFVTFRYTAATMPFALYLFMWSLSSLIPNIKISDRLIVAIAFFGVVFCSHNLSTYIVGSHKHEMNYIRSEIETKALKKLREGQEVTIYILKKEPANYLNGFSYREYGLPVSFSYNWLVSATTYLMRQYDYESIMTSYKVEKWDEKAIRVKTQWGSIISASDLNELKSGDKNKVIIDMNQLGNYR